VQVRHRLVAFFLGRGVALLASKAALATTLSQSIPATSVAFSTFKQILTF
jgi:hypothetical protein